MKNSILDNVFDLKQRELNQLRSATESYYSETQYEKINNFHRPQWRVEKEFFENLDPKKIKCLIDEPLRSEMTQLFRDGHCLIMDKQRNYVHYKRIKLSNSFDDLYNFHDYNIRTVEEVVCTAAYLICHFFSGGSPVISDLLNDGQENLDLGIIILKKPMIKGVYEPEVAYNVHLEMKKGKDGEVEEIHLHLFEFPRSFKINRHCLI